MSPVTELLSTDTPIHQAAEAPADASTSQSRAEPDDSIGTGAHGPRAKRSAARPILTTTTWWSTAIEVSWVEGPGSPAPMYRARGYDPPGEIDDGEIHAIKRLT